ncbi:MAG: hypothetical protein Q9160_006145 [Pyrenula sp. 1 TL-2023]
MASKELIVLTAASGKQCAHLIPLLYKNPGYQLRLVVHSDKSVDHLRKTYPDADVVQADLVSITDCSKIVQGATVVYHINPAFHPRETDIGKNVVDATATEAQNPGAPTAHFIFSSVLNPQLSKLLNHIRKNAVEEHLMESGLPYTILNPAHFIDNTLPMLIAQRKAPTITFPSLYPSTIGFSFLALSDLAEASAKIIQERSKHFYAQYPLAGTGPVPYTEYLDIVARELGRPDKIQIQDISYTEAVDKLCERILGPNANGQGWRDAAERMLLWYNTRGLVGNPNVLEWILERPPTSIAQAARNHIDAVGNDP